MEAEWLNVGRRVKEPILGLAVGFLVVHILALLVSLCSLTPYGKKENKDMLKSSTSNKKIHLITAHPEPLLFYIFCQFHCSCHLIWFSEVSVSKAARDFLSPRAQ